MTIIVIAPLPREAEQRLKAAQEAMPAPQLRMRANSSCFITIARFLIWATRNS